MSERWLAIGVVASLLGCAAARADTLESAGLILPDDPRFDVFELSNSAGDGTFRSPHGTVLLSFASKDSRFCRAARIPADKAVVLACREEQGWKIEAASSVTPAEATNPTNFGGGGMQEVSDAVESLRTPADLLDGPGIIEAAGRGWRNPPPFDDQSLDARDILRRTAQVYRASKSYIDTGTVQTAYLTQLGERIGETRFKTAYVAPFDFRFESKMGDFGTIEVVYIAWMGRTGVDTWFSVKPDREAVVTTIQDALDEAAGISRDSSGMIPGLIFPGTKLGGDIVRLTSPVRLEDAQIDGFDCFQVQGFRWPYAGDPTTVWIDKDLFLIRRVYEEGKIKDGTTKTTWFYTPAINVPVEAESLVFNRPAIE